MRHKKKPRVTTPEAHKTDLKTSEQYWVNPKGQGVIRWVSGKPALALAVECGLAVEVLAAPPGIDVITGAVADFRNGEARAVFRFHGWRDARRNGWQTVCGAWRDVFAVYRLMIADGVANGRRFRPMPKGERN